jgi:hypothetical protein
MVDLKLESYHIKFYGDASNEKIKINHLITINSLELFFKKFTTRSNVFMMACASLNLEY